MTGAPASPLVKRILLLVGGLGVAVSLVWGVIASEVDRSRSLQAATESAQSAIEASAEPIALAAWLLDQRLLAAHTRGLLENRAIVHARVVAPDGTTLAEAGSTPPGPTTQRRVALHSPDGKTPIGELQVTQSLRDIEAEVSRRSAWLFAGELVKVLLLMAVVLVVVHMLVTRRLTRLSQQLQAAPADGTPATITVPMNRITGRDELVLLAEVLDQHLRDREAVRRLARERDSAEAASQAKSDFLSRMSHELRTPLNGILGFAQAFRRHPAVAGNETLLRYARLMLRSGWHLKSLIDDVLDLSRIESGTARIALGPVDVGSTVDAAVAMLRTEAEARRVVVDSHVGHHRLPAAVADPLRLQQVLINLVSNAIKYNREGGQLQLDAGARDGRVWIRVSDTGLGMSPEQLAMLFQPFNRLGREDSGASGTGIGLVITQRLVEMMNGQIQVDSAAGVGSHFTVWLPASDVPAEPLATRPAKLGPAAGLRRTVLYVEDDPVNVEVMRALLQARPMITLEVAPDLASASMQIGLHTPDLVLLDMNLPDGEGLVLLQALREDPQHHDLPVVVVSADAMDASVGRAMQAGAQAYLSKPYNFDAALREVDKLLA
ncbi:ATP-binding protein [Ideonella sp. DXS29W]|uniref:histidine kinase n=1 Tax=Ideonella lacteola TaxID=2984193 RepID=A0ABU9BST0_9BURK